MSRGILIKKKYFLMNFSLDILGRFCYNVGFFKGENLVEHYIKTEKICQENFLIFSLDI